MKGKFDWDKLRDDVTKLKFKGLGIIILVLLIVFAISLVTGKDLLSPGDDSGGSGNSAVVTSEDTEASTEDETEANTAETAAPSETAVGTEKTTAAKVTTAKVTATKKVTTAKVTTAKKVTATAAPTENKYTEYHFRSKSQLDQHFDKHGGEFKKDFGYKTAAEYEKGASDVINNPKALCKTEKEDGDYVYYIEATNEFVILSTDGYIRTYFRPSAGIDYFNRQ